MAKVRFILLFPLQAPNDGTGTDNVEAALCFYRALKVYPSPSDLICKFLHYDLDTRFLTCLAIYDKTVPKPVLDILAEMIAFDSELNVTPFPSLPWLD